MLGLFAMIIMQLSSIPTVLGYTTLPPIEMMLLIFCGNLLFLVDAYNNKMSYYVLGSLFGMIMQIIIIGKIWF